MPIDPTLYYGNPADCKQYALDHSMPVPASWATDDGVAADLLLASEFIDGRYGPQFSGTKSAGRSQVRMQPRYGQWDRDGYGIANPDGLTLPREILFATYEAAWRSGTTPGSLIVDFTPSKYLSVRIEGALQVEYNAQNVAADIQTQFTKIDQILAPILTGLGIGSMSGLSGYAKRV